MKFKIFYESVENEENIRNLIRQLKIAWTNLLNIYKRYVTSISKNIFEPINSFATLETEIINITRDITENYSNLKTKSRKRYKIELSKDIYYYIEQMVDTIGDMNRFFFQNNMNEEIASVRRIHLALLMTQTNPKRYLRDNGGY